MDVVTFVTLATATTIAFRRTKLNDTSDKSSLVYVTRDNERVTVTNLLSGEDDHNNTQYWHRATCVLVMCDPPEMFYEPKEWSHTTVLLWKNNHNKLTLPGGPLRVGQTYVQCASRHLKDLGIDVCQPENCLHHLFTFAYEDQHNNNMRQWSDFMEGVYRGGMECLPDHETNIVRMSLEELKDTIVEDPIAFDDVTLYSLRLYFQRQLDLRAQRRILKGYSSNDLEQYFGLKHGSEIPRNIVFRVDEQDNERRDALDYTMKTDDGMSPRLLHEADVVLLGVSRAGKTPLSLLLSQTTGIKVANVPLVLEVPPPQQLFDKVNPKRVFCITQQAEHLVLVRRSRLRRELKKQVGSRSTYADLDYVRRDLDHAKEVCREHGYTIIDITDRAMEEAAGLIMSKLKERFPNCDFGDLAM